MQAASESQSVTPPQGPAGEPEKTDAEPASQSTAERAPSESHTTGKPEAESPEDHPIPHELNASVKVNVNRARFRDLKTYTTILNLKGWQESAAEPSLADVLAPLPQLALEELEVVRALQDEVCRHARILQRERALLVRCHDPRIARAAAMALIEQLGVPLQHRKILKFERARRDVELTIHHLLGKRVDAQAEVVILADAARSKRARQFVDSMLSLEGDWTRLALAESLRDAGVWLICGTEREEGAATWIDGPPVESWTVSSLQILLRDKFIDEYQQIEAEILRGRGGRWSRDPAELERQVASMTADEIRRALSEHVTAGSHVISESLLSRDRPLHLAVLYAATFYPKLSPHELGRVVTALVAEQTGNFLVSTRQKTKDGTFKEVELRHERKLKEVWAAQADWILNECGLITTMEEGSATIAFSEFGRRDQLRNEFERSHGVYVRNQFVAAHERLFFTDPSEQIAKDVIALTLAMVRDDQADFGVDWLYGLVTPLCAARSVDAAEPGAAEPGAEEGKNVDAEAFIYSRVVELLRALLDDPDAVLQNLVPGLLRLLLARGEQALVFNLLKRLRYAPSFDIFPWLQQLVEQGRTDVRAAVHQYLVRDISQPGRTWPLIETLDSWLSADGGRAADRLVPRLVAEYAVISTMNFGPAHYGYWPSRFPLFAVDAEDAERRFRILFDVLLREHDSLAADEMVGVRELLPPLICEWAAILLRPSGDETPGERKAASEFAPEDALTILIHELASATNTAKDRGLQQAMLFEWESLKQDLSTPPELDDTLRDVRARQEAYARLRRERARDRALLVKLIVKFREALRALPPQRPLPRATA